MRYCKHCGSKMNEVLSFSKDRRVRYYGCVMCRNETLKNKLTDKELDERFGEVNTYGKKVSKY